ncbi:MAG: hypothetical protein ABIO70_10810 [Pseudomonadota bacterium]
MNFKNRHVSRFLGHFTLTPRRVLVAGLVAATVLFGVGLGPLSPLALDRADRALAQGHTEASLRTCRRIARFSPFPGLRDEARYRAALLLASQGGERGEALVLLRDLLRDAPHDAALRGDALALLASVLEGLGQEERAARRYEQRAALGPDPAPWLLSAASAWERGGNERLALLRLARVATSGAPEAARARLAMGRIFLGEGEPARAYAHYTAALALQPGPDEARLARLGKALALDALGQAEQAVAELDGADPANDPAIGITRERVARRAEESGVR